MEADVDAMRDEEEGAGGVPTVPTTGAQVRAYPLRLFLVHPQAEWSAHNAIIAITGMMFRLG